MKPTTAQQVNTLLYYLQTKQTPPFKVLFWSDLQKIDFDYSANSLQLLGRFFAAMAKRHVQLTQLLASQGGQAFVVAVAAYIADYLAKSTGQSIQWYDYEAMSVEVARQNAKHHMQLQFSADFYSSLTARIGQKVYCQPLKLLPSLLQGEDVLPQFMAEMTHAIYQQSQVNLLQSPDEVCHGYLAKVKTGKLHDSSIAFCAYLVGVNFDYSHESLAQIDSALSAIQQNFGFAREDYLGFMQDSSHQAFCYLLGFYLGVTSSRLANVPVRWVSFEQMYESLGEEFGECLEHSFVLLFEDCYRTPMLVVTNRLFGLANHFPSTATAFADILKAQNKSQIAIYPYQGIVEADVELPLQWLSVMQAAGGVIAAILTRLSQGQPILPCLYQTNVINKVGELPIISPSDIQLFSVSDTDTDLDTVIDGLYHTLYQNPQLAAMMVGCFDSHVNLPMGRTDGIVIETRAYDNPSLQLQLVLPYQSANDGHHLKIYPLVSLSSSAQHQTVSAQQIEALTSYFYQAIINACAAQHTVIKTIWQEAFVNQLDFWAIPPKDRWLEQQNNRLADGFDFALLPIPDSDTTVNSSVMRQIAPFDYTTVEWRGYDLAKHIMELNEDDQRFLQVYASDSLIRDELYRQAEATEQLYRYGKVVWGVVLHCDDELTQPISEDERDNPYANHAVRCADILYDPLGQATVEALQAKAKQLVKTIDTSNQQLHSFVEQDVAFYQLHWQDAKSRVFNLVYPASIAAVDYRITTSWVWRRHLPNGMLSSRVVPIIIDTCSDKNRLEQGEIMVLPSKLWDKAYYHYWLSLAYQQFGQDYDLLPYINWQQKYGQDITDAATQKRLFPKSRPSRSKHVTIEKPVQTTVSTQKLSSPRPTMQQQANQQAKIQQPSNQKMAMQAWSQPQTQSLPSATNLSTDFPTLLGQNPAPMIDSNLSIMSSTSTAQTPNTTSQPALSEHLKQQLINDKLRLQTQLSTQNKDKEKKLMVIFASIGLVMLIAVVLIKLSR